jgi:hypothetical protein
MNKIKFHHLIIVLFYLIFFLLLLKNSFSYLDPDFGWHLKAGEEVHLNRVVPYENYYNYVFPAEENFWINHEWLSDYLLFLAYDNWGYPFINIFFALLIVLTLIILNNFVSKKILKDNRSIYILLTIEVLALRAMLPHFGVRIQEISVLFLLLLLIIIFNFEKRALNKNSRYFLILLWLIPLLYLWANLHAGFLLGIFILFFYLGIKIAEKIVFNFKEKRLGKTLSSFFNLENSLSNKNLKIFSIFSLLAIASTTLTPYGLKLFDFLSSYKNTAYLKMISEWLPQYYWPLKYEQLLYIGLVLTGWIITLAFYKNYQKNQHGKIFLTPWMIAINLLFIFLAIKSKRHFPLFFIISLPFIASFFYHELKEVLSKGSQKTNKITDWFLKIFLISTFACVSAIILININIVRNPFNHFSQSYPRDATNFLKENHEKYFTANIFNNYAWGGYLIHEYPGKKLFIDGRLPQKEINNHSYIEEYNLFFSKEEDIISEKIKEYEIKLFLLEKPRKIKTRWLDRKIFNLKEKYIESENRLINCLEKSDFIKVYEDDISVIYYQE